MDTKNRPVNRDQKQNVVSPDAGKGSNPFENNQPVERDIAQAEEDLQNEQQFKEAQTERD